MSKNETEKCRKLRIFSILSSERGITPTKIDDTRTCSNVLKKKESYKISVPYVKAYRRKVRKTVTNEWTDGRIPMTSSVQKINIHSKGKSNISFSKR